MTVSEQTIYEVPHWLTASVVLGGICGGLLLAMLLVAIVARKRRG
jgi:hypothetical protein